MVCQKYMKWYTAGIPKVYWMVFKRHIQGILKVYQRFIQDIFMVNKIVNQTHIEAIIKVCSLYITYGWSRRASYSGSTSSKKQPCPKKKCNTYISWGSVGGAEHIYIYIIIYIYICTCTCYIEWPCDIGFLRWLCPELGRQQNAIMTPTLGYVATGCDGAPISNPNMVRWVEEWLVISFLLSKHIRRIWGMVQYMGTIYGDIFLGVLRIL